MAYLGKEFKFSSQENFEAMVNSFGSAIADNVKQAILNHKGTVKLVKNGDQYTLSLSEPGGKIRDVTFKSGVPFDEEVNGNKGKTTITVTGDVLTAVTAYENGTTLTITREFSPTQVVSTVQSTEFSGVAKRIFKA